MSLNCPLHPLCVARAALAAAAGARAALAAHPCAAGAIAAATPIAAALGVARSYWAGCVAGGAGAGAGSGSGAGSLRPTSTSSSSAAALAAAFPASRAARLTRSSVSSHTPGGADAATIFQRDQIGGGAAVAEDAATSQSQITR